MISNTLEIPVNEPQLIVSLIRARITSCIWGRFTGKSEGPGADFTKNNIYKMPRSNGFIQGTTYEQILTRTLPALVAGWERHKLFEGEHYWIGRFPDEKLKIPNAIRQPRRADHYIKWHNGSGIYLVSQDRGSTINGVRSQWGFADEAKLLNKKKFDEETIPTMAGGENLWGKESGNELSEYLSLLFCSDMPSKSHSKWLLDFEEQVDKRKVQLILCAQMEIMEHEEKLRELTGAEAEKRAARVQKLQQDINDMRKELVYVSLASALENIQFVGLDPIKQAKRILTDIQFRVSIMNERIMKVENGFYATIDPRVNGYDNVNYTYVDKLSFDYKTKKQKDCRWDGDINSDEPLDIAMDHNNAINGIITGQDFPGESRMLSSMYVEHPLMLDDCVKLWHEYYKYHKTKDVNYYYDSTSVKGDARSDISFADEVTAGLIRLGWNVNRIDIGQIGSHHSRFLFWGKFAMGNDARLPQFRYNKTNCSSWETSALQAGVIKQGKKVQKDKSSEKPGSGVPPPEATHLSEAADILFWGKFRKLFVDDSSFVGLVHSD